MMSKLTAKDDGTNKQFKPKIYQSTIRQQKEISMINIITIREIIKIGIDQIAQIEFHLTVGFSVGKIIDRYGQSYRNDFRRGNFRDNVRMYKNQNFRRQNIRGGYRGNYRNENYEICRSRSRERQYQHNSRMTEVAVVG